MIADKAIRFRHLDYNNPDRAQQLISSSMSRHLSTYNISSKSMHAFSSKLNLATNRQTDKRDQTHLPPPLSEVKLSEIMLVYVDIPARRDNNRHQNIPSLAWQYATSAWRLSEHCELSALGLSLVCYFFYWQVNRKTVTAITVKRSEEMAVVIGYCR